MANSKTGLRESASADSRTSEPRSASIHFLNSSTRLGQRQSSVPSTQMPPTLRNETAELLADIDGLSILVRFIVKDLPAEMQSNDGDLSPKVPTFIRCCRAYLRRWLIGCADRT